MRTSFSKTHTLCCESLERRFLLSAQPLLPDLVPYATDTRTISGFSGATNLPSYLDTTALPGRTLLRIASAVANVGDGPLWIQSVSTDGALDQVDQRIRHDDGSVTTRLAGHTVHHLGHGHVHFDDFAAYRLYEVIGEDEVGAIVAASEKVSFCLHVLGAAEYPPDELDAKFGIRNERLRLGTGDVVVQDLAIERLGDIDKFQYRAYRSGDAVFDLSFDDSFGDIDMYLRWTDAMQNEHVIAAKTNGAAESIAIPLLEGQVVEVAVQETSGATNPSYLLSVDGPNVSPDVYEPNDDDALASDLGSSNHHLTDLNLHRAGDVDTFLWTASKSGLVHLESTALSAGENEVEFVGPDGQSIPPEIETRSGGLQFPVVENAIYTIRVQEKSRRFSGNYEFIVNMLTIPPDSSEPNDRSFATEIDIYDRVIHGSISHPGDEDYFEFLPRYPGLLNARIEFDNSVGAIELVWHDDDHDGERATIVDENTQKFSESVRLGAINQLEVRGIGFATNPSYTLYLDFPDSPTVRSVAYRDSETDTIVNVPGSKAAFQGSAETRIDSIKIEFGSDMIVAETDLQIRGTNQSIYLFASFNYDPETFAATWEIQTPVQLDEIQLTLPATIVDTSGTQLGNHNGEVGVPFAQTFVAADDGDVSLDGVVDTRDFAALQQSLFQSGTKWSGGDQNLDGTTDVSDFNIWNQARFQTENAQRAARTPRAAIRAQAIAQIVEEGVPNNANGVIRRRVRVKSDQVLSGVENSGGVLADVESPKQRHDRVHAFANWKSGLRYALLISRRTASRRI